MYFTAELKWLIFFQIWQHILSIYFGRPIIQQYIIQRIGCRAVFQKLAADFMYTLEEEERDQQWAFYFQGTFEVIYYAQWCMCAHSNYA